MAGAVDHLVRGWLWVDLSGPERLSVTFTLRYRSDDPLAVHMVFPARICGQGTGLTWCFARTLMAEGLVSLAGEGDVQIWPGSTRSVMIRLRSEGGAALLELPRRDLRRYLAATYHLVPHGHELARLDIDSLIGALRLGSDRPRLTPGPPERTAAAQRAGRSRRPWRRPISRAARLLVSLSARIGR